MFIRDDDDWCAQGRYETIISRTPTPEDYIKWMKDENDKEFIRVLGVSLLIYIYIEIINRLPLILVLPSLFQALPVVALVLDLVQHLDHIQLHMVQMLRLFSLVFPTLTCRHLSRVLQILINSMGGICLLNYVIA